MGEDIRVLKDGFDLVFDRLATRLDDAARDLNWRPDPSWNSEGVLIRHACAACVGLVVGAVAGRGHERLTHDEQFAEGTADRQALARMVAESREAVLAALDGVTDLDGMVSVWGAERSRRSVAISALGHANQHIGQMTLMDRVRKAAAA